MPWPSSALPVQDGDAALAVDADPGVEERAGLRLPGRSARRRRSACLCAAAALRAEPTSAPRRRGRPARTNDEAHHLRSGAARTRGARSCLRRALDRPQDAHVRAAAAQVGLQRRADLGVRRRCGLFSQQRLRPHDHAGDAVAALRGLLFDEGALHRAGLVDACRAPRAS